MGKEEGRGEWKGRKGRGKRRGEKGKGEGKKEVSWRRMGMKSYNDTKKRKVVKLTLSNS